MDHSGTEDKKGFCVPGTKKQKKKVFSLQAMAKLHNSSSSQKVVVTLNTLTLFLLSILLLFSCYPTKSLCKGGVASDEKEDSSSAGVGESVEEDAEYMDDEVRFVTEDDFLYEEERSHYRDFHQGARGGASFLQFERCPPLPELDPSAVASSGICDAKRCQRDDECSRDSSVICCYNGCIYACLPKVNPPVAFDWVEETDMKFLPDQNQDSSLTDPRLSMGLSPKALFNAEISPETISLPGGCFINSKQYDDLLMFRKFDHVRACSCTKGEVFCEITQEPIDIKG